MPFALVRAVDSHAIALTTALVGRSPWADWAAAEVARHLAKLHVLTLGLLLLGGRGSAGRRRRAAGWRIAVALPLTIAAVSLVGRLFERDRPFSRHTSVAALVAHAPHRSFPSRHSACAAAMATVALPDAPWAGSLMILGALGLAVSRVYSGLHYPSDVFGGWLIGISIGIIARQKEIPGAPWT